MEGVLLKWTNYVSGWQHRYFTLKDGILSYYLSREQVNSGCKGSFKLSVCDVVVHSTDSRRFDLIVGEQRFYLRALSKSDRQHWVVALGSEKVGMARGKLGTNCSTKSDAQAIVNHRSELRLYHNLMVQQVRAIQNKLKQGSVPDIDHIDELTSILNASCTTFLITLDQLMLLSNANLLSSTLSTSIDSSYQQQMHTQQLAIDHFVEADMLVHCHSPSSATSMNSSPIIGRNDVAYSDSMKGARALHCSPSPDRIQSRRPNRLARKYHTFFSTMEYSFEDIKPLIPYNPTVREFNCKLPADYISASEFAQASRWAFGVLDRLAHQHYPTNLNSDNQHHLTPNTSRVYIALQQVKSYLLNNIRRIELHVESLRVQCASGSSTRPSLTTLTTEPIPVKSRPINENGYHDKIRDQCEEFSIGALVRAEVENKMIHEEGSIYVAILWLCRSLNFVRELLHQLFHPSDASELRSIVETSQRNNLIQLANEAYTRCLRPHHPWSVRGMAMVIIQTLPSRIYFLNLLLMDNLRSTNKSSSASNNQHWRQQQTSQYLFTCNGVNADVSDPTDTIINSHANNDDNSDVDDLDIFLMESPTMHCTESYVQLKLDAVRYEEALGRFLTLIEGLLASLDLQRIFTGLESYL